MSVSKTNTNTPIQSYALHFLVWPSNEVYCFLLATRTNHIFEVPIKLENTSHHTILAQTPE